MPVKGEKMYHLTYEGKDSENRHMFKCDCGNILTLKKGETPARVFPKNGKKPHYQTCGRKCPYYLKQLAERKRTHGAAPKDTKKREWLYGRLRSMFKRCENTNAGDYPRYGGIGVTVHQEWKNDYKKFLRDLEAFPDPRKEPHLYKRGSESEIEATLFYRWFEKRGSGKRACAQDVIDWLATRPKKDTAQFWEKWSIDRIQNVMPDGSIGSYVPGNVRLLDRRMQSRNRNNTIRINGVSLTAKAEEAGLKPATVRRRYKRGDSDPLRELVATARPEADAAILEALKSGILEIAADGRIVRWKDSVATPLIPSVTGNGRYLCVKLPRKLKKKHNLGNEQVMMHRVVPIYFQGQPNPKNRLYQVHHLDQVRTHNHPENLQWVLPEGQHFSTEETKVDRNELETKWREYYQNRDNYTNLLGNHIIPAYEPFSPTKARNDNELLRINDILLNYPLASWFQGQNPGLFLKLLISAPSNFAQLEGDKIWLRIRNLKDEQERIELKNLKGTYLVYCCCPNCNFEIAKPKEVRGYFGRERSPYCGFTPVCNWCASVALSKPALAQCFAEGEPGGKSPYLVAAEDHRKYPVYCINRIKQSSCKSGPFLFSPHNRTQGPICDACRALMRAKNLGKYIKSNFN